MIIGVGTSQFYIDVWDGDRSSPGSPSRIKLQGDTVVISNLVAVSYKESELLQALSF